VFTIDVSSSLSAGQRWRAECRHVSLLKRRTSWTACAAE